MSQKGAVFLASRLLAIYLFCWMLSDLTYLPERIIAFEHYAHESSVLLSHNYFYNYAAVTLAFHVLRIALLLAGSIWFYQCGPRIQAFFLQSHSANEPLN